MKPWLAVLLIAGAPAGAETIDLSQARTAIAERQAICDADQGRMWGKTLCGPIIFVEDASHDAVANQAGQSGILSARSGLFTGKLPATQTVANTAFDWDGVRWTMLEWPIPENKAERDTLLMHESWHRIQDEIGLPMRSPVADHLGPAFGRIALRLEWRALAAALTASGDAARKGAIRDALLFRQWRRTASRQAGEIENQLELNEGLAEYTGRKLAGQDAAAIAARLERAEHKSSFARSFAYASGPAYGYLLDLAAPDWRKHLSARSDLGALLAKADKVPAPKDPAREAKAAGQRYFYAALAAEEHDAERRRADQARHWSEILLKGPVLRLPMAKMQVRFDPNTLFPLPPHGTVYPSFELIDEWGSLKTDTGLLIDKKWSSAVLPASAKDNVSLKPGWSWKPGKRKGDLVAAKD
jgi:hypothetical protein